MNTLLFLALISYANTPLFHEDDSFNVQDHMVRYEVGCITDHECESLYGE